MVLYCYADDEPDTFIYFEPVYIDKQQHTDHDNNPKNPNLLFDFELVYRLAPESDSDSDEYEDFSNLETRVVHQTHEFRRDWLIGGDRAQIQATVCQILDLIQVPSYSEIVHTLTIDFLDLKKREATFVSPEVERVRVEIDVIVREFPGDVNLAVAPASEEAAEKHLPSKP